MTMHRCNESNCSYFQKATTKGCLCHKTDEQMLREQVAELLAALREAHRALNSYEWYNNPKSGWASDDNTTVRGMVDAAIANATGIPA